MCCHASLLA
ncbi:hypothetical protein Ahy_B09g098789 isoform C [Arachis hypogaea]|uniref:Uncharacterized protein n=1 Tax=Arachis hypogaea TaxID=3818 RepID=A0A444XS59_ARAHY|nr:hypothetical protein Ahy_B09g098789 isoform C [Arachis hypogaea]